MTARFVILGSPRTKETFWSRVDKNGPAPPGRPGLGPCWAWRGTINVRWGYGYFSWEGQRNLRAHIVAYTLAVGPVPEGLVLDHLCRARHCVNPEHLEPVTQQENCRRGMTGKAPGTTGERNKAKTHCPRGHEYAGANLRLHGRRRHCRACDRARWVEA